MLELIQKAYERLLGHGNTRLDAYRCCMFVNGVQCKRVALSKAKIILHLAVEHGVRPVTKEQLNGIQIRTSAK